MRATRFTTHCRNALKSTALLAAFSMLSINGVAQEGTSNDKPKFFPKLFGLNKGVSVGIIGGTADHFDYGILGINATFNGVYADVMGWPGKRLEYKDGNSSKKTSTWALHVGYQIPFHQYKDGSIRLIPLIGYYSGRKTTLYNFNEFTETASERAEKTGSIDYGAALAFQQKDSRIGAYNFYIGYTRYTAWIGLGYELPLRQKEKTDNAQEGTPTKSSSPNNSITIGVIGGGVDGFNYGAIGMNLTFKGFYLDFMGWPWEHESDPGTETWDDHAVLAFHAGYQIPLLNRKRGGIRLIPLIGYTEIKKGKTKGDDFYFDESGIHNKHITTDKYGGFDYGGALVFNLNYGKRRMGTNLYLAYTRYTAWAGLGFEIPQK